LATPPGLSGFTGAGRARPSPVVRLFSYKTCKSAPKIQIDLDGRKVDFNNADHSAQNDAHKKSLKPHREPSPKDFMDSAEVEVPLIQLAWGRSGDKGDKANVGIIARKPEYMSFIWWGLSDEILRNTYAHFSPGTIEKFYLPGSNAINFLIDNVLGGGGAASLRNDAQAKGYAQLLLTQPIPVSKSIAESL
jgi:hypothetical protein